MVLRLLDEKSLRPAPERPDRLGRVNERIGLTFASGLRNILRQDPDVIMVGECRDGETARIAIQASLMAREFSRCCARRASRRRSWRGSVARSTLANAHLVIFARQFASMTASGLQLVTVLDNFARETPNRALRLTVAHVTREVTSGVDLSDALERHPRLFGGVFVGVVRSGLEVGALPGALAHVVDFLTSTAFP